MSYFTPYLIFTLLRNLTHHLLQLLLLLEPQLPPLLRQNEVVPLRLRLRDDLGNLTLEPVMVERDEGEVSTTVNTRTSGGG